MKGNILRRNGQFGILLGREVQEVTVTENEVIGNDIEIVTSFVTKNNFIMSNTVLESLFVDLFDAGDAENDYASCGRTTSTRARFQSASMR